MTSVLAAKIPSFLRTSLIQTTFPLASCQRLISLSSVDLRARKGTREKAKKKKVKVEVKKLDFHAKLARAKDKNKDKSVNKPEDDSLKPISCDDVWQKALYKWKVYSVPEAIECFKETNSPSVYNMPDALLKLRIELNMIAMKTTRFVDNFTRIALIPHGFETDGKRKILVFSKDQAVQKAAVEAGASFSGGVELVKSIQKGDLLIGEYQYILAHPDSMADIIPLRGIMKKKFPNIKLGSVDTNVPKMVQRFLKGMEYTANKHEYEPSFGLIETYVGKLNMETKQLEENLVEILKDVDSVRPKRDGLFISRCFLECQPNKEKLKIDPFVYIESGVVEDIQSADDSDGEKAKQDDDSDDEDVKKAVGRSS